MVYITVVKVLPSFFLCILPAIQQSEGEFLCILECVRKDVTLWWWWCW